ncbi:MAG: glycine zipper 2TM domain-containing protein [Undibacterium sp.]|nr:glycine zipper 2TM domain-containing protein [Undibacterium sp.]
MRKIALILSLVALSQLTGCVAHRYYADAPARTDNGYNQPYPAQYPTQYQDRYAYQQPQQVQQPPNTYRSDYQGNDQQAQGNFAQIIDIRRISEATRSNGGGAVIGAIIGGIIGNQLGRNDGHGASHSYGHGRGRDRGYSSNGNRDAATLGGAIVGGVIGNEVERTSTEQRIRTEITLRFSNGQTQTVPVDNPGNFRSGDWVRVGFQAGRWVIY